MKLKINSSVEFALNSKSPASTIENELKDVYKDNKTEIILPIFLLLV